MPKPFFTKLVAIVMDKIQNYYAPKSLLSPAYLSLDVSCTKREQTLFGKNQQYWFASDNGKEYAFSLEKNIKLLEGHRYRLYFRKPQQGTGQSMPCAGDILGYEELTDQLPELPDTSV